MAEIQRRQVARAQRTQVTQDRVLLELARVGFSDARQLLGPDGKFVALKDLPDSIAAAVASIEVINRKVGELAYEQVVKVKLWNKPAALTLMAEHVGLVRRREADDPPVPTPATTGPRRVIFGGRYKPPATALVAAKVSA